MKKCAKFEKQPYASSWTRTDGELPRLETQSGFAQASFVIGPLGRLPFRLRSAPQVTNPRRHLDGPTMELRRTSTVSLRRAHQAVVRTVALGYPAHPPIQLPPANLPRGSKQSARRAQSRGRVGGNEHVPSRSLGHTAAVHPTFVVAL